jgi:hypothetical protein
MMAAHEFGVTMEQYCKNSKIIDEAIIAAVNKYQYDSFLIDIDTVTMAGAVSEF